MNENEIVKLRLRQRAVELALDCARIQNEVSNVTLINTAKVILEFLERKSKRKNK